MKTGAIIIIALLVSGLVLGTLLLAVPGTREIVSTTTRIITLTETSTITKFATVTRQGYGLPTPLLEKLSSMVPDYDRAQAYHIYVPGEPGVYSYGFAVFWRYGENHTHLIIFHALENKTIIIGLNSLIQTRFAAAKNIPNTPAAFIPRAEMTETVITDSGQTLTRRWEIIPTSPGYPSTPQVERAGDMVWVIQYRLLDEREYGESLVARYYFLEIIVR
ncbi:MAG: hypothetical protein QXE96_03770 [Candidatus Caldarchaeum sp.]